MKDAVTEREREREEGGENGIALFNGTRVSSRIPDTGNALLIFTTSEPGNRCEFVVAAAWTPRRYIDPILRRRLSEAENARDVHLG